MRAALVSCSIIIWLLPAIVAAYPSDEQIASDVTAAVSRFPSIQPYRLEVTVSEGRVRLSGAVTSATKKKMVTDIAGGVRGVEEVTNDMEVTYENFRVEEEGGAEALCTRVRERISKTPYLQGSTLHLTCEGEAVTLMGTVNTEAQRASVGDIAATTPGVAKVSNLMRVGVQVDDEVLSRRVEEDLVRKSGLNLSGISFSVNDGVVTWRGYVDRHERIDAVLSRTLMVPGVKDIRSEVRIGTEENGPAAD